MNHGMASQGMNGSLASRGPSGMSECAEAKNMAGPRPPTLSLENQAQRILSLSESLFSRLDHIYNRVHGSPSSPSKCGEEKNSSPMVHNLVTAEKVISLCHAGLDELEKTLFHGM